MSTQNSISCTMALTSALFLAVLPAILAADGGVTLDPTILLLGSFDYMPYQSVPPFTSRCTDMVKRAAELGTNKLQLTPTHYWRSMGMQGAIRDFCWVDKNNECQPFTESAIRDFEKGMQLCISSAVNEHGFTSITFTPHIDSRDTGDGWTIRAWRNGLVLDPRQKHGGWSYEQIMLEPMARAFAPFLRSGSAQKKLERLDFGLQGEMGASVMRFPTQYSALIPAMRSILLGGKPSPAGSREPNPARSARSPSVRLFPDAQGFQNLMELWDSGMEQTGGMDVFPFPGLMRQSASFDGGQVQQGQGGAVMASGEESNKGQVMQQSAGAKDDDRVRFGLSFNFIYADGSQRYTTSLLGQLGVAFVGSWFGFRPGFDAPLLDPAAVEALMYQCDFLGISAYHPLDLDFKTNELQNSVFNVVDGFESVGIDLDAVLKSPRANGGSKEILYVEFGIGGGASQAGQDKANSPSQVIQTPYWGVQGPYKKSKDPWRTDSMRTFLHSFYARVFKWLSQRISQGTGPTYKISSCFVWNHGSFDIWAIHPESTTEEGSYRDPVLVKAAFTHNTRMLSQ